MKAPAQKFDAPGVGARFVTIECECEDLKLDANTEKCRQDNEKITMSLQ